MHGQPDATTRLPTHWWQYDITVTELGTGHHWHRRMVDPVDALDAASAQIAAPVIDNHFTHPGALGALLAGGALCVACADGTTIAVTPILT